MKHFAPILFVTVASAALAVSPSKKTSKPKAPQPKRYLHSVKPLTPKAPLVPTAPKRKVEAHTTVFREVADAASIPIENPQGLIPFFEQLHRAEHGDAQGPVRILHYGDSHTAADDWTNTIRVEMQERFGDGGSGYSVAGRPYSGYRRFDVRSGSTRGWHTDGLAGKPGDGIYGLGGVSLTVQTPHESVYVEAESSRFELYYYQQPGGGSLQIFDNGTSVDVLSTDGPAGPAYFALDTDAGQHRLEVETIDRAPVRLFGWVAERPKGVTYEALGINGATAPMILDWDDTTLQSNIAHHSPAMIVLAYGTNEAGRKAWTVDSYKETFARILKKVRAAAPAATILVVGPPDRFTRTRKGWQVLDQVDTIVEAQRQAAAENGCPFWDLRSKMGGKSTMPVWIKAGLAQNDHVHFTSEGYRLLGEALYRDLMSQYELFEKARAGLLAARR